MILRAQYTTEPAAHRMAGVETPQIIAVPDASLRLVLVAPAVAVVEEELQRTQSQAQQLLASLF